MNRAQLRCACLFCRINREAGKYGSQVHVIGMFARFSNILVNTQDVPAYVRSTAHIIIIIIAW